MKRLLITASALALCASCAAPILLSQTDCSRYVAEYRARLLHTRAGRALRTAKRRLVHRQVRAGHPLRHRMGPAESLHRLEIACAPLEDAPTLTGLLPPVDASPLEVEWPDALPPQIDYPAPLQVAELPPVPIVPPIAVLPTPEVPTLFLMATGLSLFAVARKGESHA